MAHSKFYLPDLHYCASSVCLGTMSYVRAYTLSSPQHWPSFPPKDLGLYLHRFAGWRAFLPKYLKYLMFKVRNIEGYILNHDFLCDSVYLYDVWACIYKNFMDTVNVKCLNPFFPFETVGISKVTSTPCVWKSVFQGQTSQYKSARFDLNMHLWMVKCRTLMFTE